LANQDLIVAGKTTFVKSGAMQLVVQVETGTACAARFLMLCGAGVVKHLLKLDFVTEGDSVGGDGGDGLDGPCVVE
jgi:hypothetical protein